MAVLISGDLYDSLEIVYVVLLMLAYVAIPVLLSLCVSCCCCCVCCICCCKCCCESCCDRSGDMIEEEYCLKCVNFNENADKGYLTEFVEILASKIFFFLEKDKGNKNIVICNYISNSFYSYYLLFSVGVFLIHAFLASWIGMIEQIPVTECNDTNGFWSSLSYDSSSQELYCIQLKLGNGIEGFLSVFTFPAVVMATITVSILYITGGRNCYNQKYFCCCRVSFALFIQFILVSIPKVLFIFYLRFNIDF